MLIDGAVVISSFQLHCLEEFVLRINDLLSIARKQITNARFCVDF